MLLLASTTDELRVVTSDSGSVDVFAAWVDLNGSTTTPGRANTLIISATTTTIVASPAASTYRTIKAVTIRNRHVFNPCRVTIVHRAAGPVDAEMISVQLMPNDSLVYNEHDTWRYVRSPYGTLSAAHDTVWLDPAVLTSYVVVLPKDVVQQDTFNNRFMDVQDLRMPVRESQRYWFNFFVMFTAAATTTGTKWSVYGPGTPTILTFQQENSLSTTTKTNNEGLSTYDTPTAMGSDVAAVGGNIIQIEGFIEPTCDGMLWLRVAAEIGGSAITLKAGSRLEWQRVV